MNRSGPAPGLAHALTGRHVRFIALGGAIGAGLFLGSGVAISRAGPALLIAYVAAGTVIFLMTRALGELALFKPVAGAFSTHARELIGPRAGFVTGWSYWLVWILVGTAEITGVGMLMRYWCPALPQWSAALAAVVLLWAVNRGAVKSYGELEFWLALLKVLTISGLLVCGLLLMSFGRAGSVANLWANGGFLPHGWRGVLRALPVALFAFGGLEVIGLTAAETDNPQASLPAAVNGVAYRILIFYIGSLAVIMMLYPWNALQGARSPFVMVLELVGMPAAAGCINLVAITALLSSCNSGIFASSRMLHSLSSSGSAPAWLSCLDSRHVPARCVDTCALLLLVGVALNYLVPERIFGYLMATVSALLLWTWGTIMICHLAYRRKVSRGEASRAAFRLPGAPISNWIVLVFIGFVAVLLLFDAGTRVAYYTAAIWFAVLFSAEWLSRARERHGRGS
jgi:amino acid transporter, AAT family